MTFPRAVFFMIFLGVNAHANLRDPTRPIEQSIEKSSQDQNNISENVEEGELKIQGLFITKSKRLALINDQFLTIGDLTTQGELVAIFKDRVVIKQGTNMHVVFLITQEVRHYK